MATSNSNSKKMNFFEVESYLLKHRKDLVCLYTESKPGFEVKFWMSNVKPLIAEIDGFCEFGITAFRCRVEAECLLRKINKFKDVYGIVKIVRKIVSEIRDLLRGYELSIKPINPRSLFDLAAREVGKHPELEIELYKADPLLSKDFNYSFNDFGKKLLKELDGYYLYASKCDYNLFLKVEKFAKEIDNENRIEKKVSITRKFWKYTKSLNQSNYCRMRVINKFLKEFMAKYEN